MRPSQYAQLPTSERPWTALATLLPYLWEFRGRVLIALGAQLLGDVLDGASVNDNSDAGGDFAEANASVASVQAGYTRPELEAMDRKALVAAAKKVEGVKASGKTKDIVDNILAAQQTA